MGVRAKHLAMQGLHSRQMLGDGLNALPYKMLEEVPELERPAYPKRNKTIRRKPPKISAGTAPSDIGSPEGTVNQTSSGSSDLSGMLQTVEPKSAGEAVKEAVGATDGQEMMIGAGKMLSATVGLFIAGTSLLDTAVTAKRNKDARAQVRQQENKLLEDEKRSVAVRRKIHKRESNVRVNVKNEVLSMFDQAIGHHKMGNSRF